MESLGIVRRIDDLGRLVIPKELRKVLNLKNGDSVEIHAEDENIIINKYSMISSIKSISQKLVDSLSKTLKKNIILTDNEEIISVSNLVSKHIVGNKISKFLTEIFEQNNGIISNEKKILEIINEYSINSYFYIKPIVVETSYIGLLIIYDENNIIDNESINLLNFTSVFLSYFIE